MSGAHRGMVFKSAPGQLDHLLLHIRYLTDTAAAEKCFFDGIIRKLRLAGIHKNLPVLRLTVGNRQHSAN